MGIGDWGFGGGDLGVGAIPQPQNTIPQNPTPNPLFYCEYNSS